jgi:hypothetical protein
MGNEFPLPQVRAALSPYIKSRQQAIEIRRILTLHLLASTSHSTEDTDAPFSISRVSSLETTAKIPSEFSVLRKEYFQALKANDRAKQEHQRLTLAPNDGLENEAKNGAQNRRYEIATYIALLRTRRRFEKLRILQDYLDTLSHKAPAKPGYLNIGEILSVLPQAPQLPINAFHESTLSKPQTSGEVSELLGRLQKAVLSAKQLLDSEKKLLARLKVENEIKQVNGNESHTGTDKVSALRRTHTELINWVEGELSKTVGADHSLIEDSSLGTPVKKSALSAPEQAEKIRLLYNDYVEARTELLAATTISGQTPSQVDVDDSKDGTPSPPQKLVEGSTPTAHITHQYLHSQILPVLTYQLSLLHQKSHITVALSKQQKGILQILERLADESHLLPSYPLLAGNARFKNVTGMFTPSSGRKERDGEHDGSNGGDECISKARAWGFATEASREGTIESVKERLDDGNAKVADASQVLADLYALIDEAPRESGKTKGRKAKRDVEKGLWGKLDGQMGVLGDGL